MQTSCEKHERVVIILDVEVHSSGSRNGNSNRAFDQHTGTVVGLLLTFSHDGNFDQTVVLKKFHAYLEIVAVVRTMTTHFSVLKRSGKQRGVSGSTSAASQSDHCSVSVALLHFVEQRLEWIVVKPFECRLYYVS